MYALIDCNNFYVSCERVFRPELNKRPVVVLSNNDGCFISRSDEVKHLNIPMGAPYFKWKEEIERHNAVVFSANFPLYGDISNRVMTILQRYTPQIEVYSIDEAFLDLSTVRSDNLTVYAETIRNTIQQWVGIPTSIGIGPTKSLAKLANKMAKKYKDMYPGGVCNFYDVANLDDLLKGIPVEEVWGIGRNLSVVLRAHGIKSVYQLKQAPDAWVRKALSVTGLRIVWELRGMSCLPLEAVRPLKKGITTSRSFGQPVRFKKELQEAISSYTARAAEKLRNDHAIASCIYVYIRTSPFQEGGYYGNGHTIALPQPTSYTPELAKYALQCLDKIYRPHMNYKKAGVMVTGILPNDRTQLSIFENTEHLEKKNHLMKAVDIINAMYGRRKVRFASEGIIKLWSGKSELRSPRYTSEWKELATVSAM